ncbi:MAG: TonB family protein [Vicingaceae bacterium]
MDTLFYFLKVGTIFSALFLIYFLMFRNNTNFQTNRIYLLLIVPISFILPYINFNVSEAAMYHITLPVFEYNNTLSDTSIFSWEDLIIFFYALVSIKLLVTFLIHLTSTLKTIAEIKKGSPKEIQPFSFFSFIHVSKSIMDEDRKAIYLHEKIHSNQIHSLDIIVYEISKILLWWNPFLWIGLNAVKSNHEFIADKLASEKANEYSSVLVAQLLGVNCSVITNNFKSKPLIKKRIMMMKTKKSNRLSVLKYALVIPVIGLSIMATSNQKVNAKNIIPKIYNEDDKVYEVVDVMPEFKGGKEALMKYLGTNIKYPKEAAKENIEGLVWVSFIIDTKGTVKEAAVKTPIHTLLDNEALRVIKEMPKWTPGKHKGKNVSVKYTLPINFKLKD